ncbi:hypothetical protein BH10BAC3_BH10BAC3_40980 [soil metagenome]
MNQVPGNNNEKLAVPDSGEKYPLEEALIKAKLVLELHNGPVDPQLRKSSEHDPRENDGEALSANDSGE